MKRRNFIRNTAVSAISLGVFSPDVIAAPLAFQSASGAHSLRELGWALSARRRFNARVASEAFAQITDSTNDLFSKRGYQHIKGTFYFFGAQEDWCFYPLVLSHTAFSTPPLVAPVFHRQGDNWHLVIVLNGFEVEAISRASQALLAHDPAALQNLVIPTGKAAPYQGATAYKTRDGIVAIKILQKGGKAQTTCTILGREGKVFNETFVSKHCLIA